MFFSHQGFDVNWGFALFLSPVVTVKLITNSINSNSRLAIFEKRLLNSNMKLVFLISENGTKSEWNDLVWFTQTWK